jgi:hypothetical protein
MTTKKKAQEPVNFKVGDTVHWISSNKAKEGTIEKVVPGGRGSANVASNFITSKGDTHRSAFGGSWDREVESYVVSVPGATAKSKPVLYWPFASLLRAGASPKQKRAKN